MKKLSDHQQREDLRQSIIGLGERSLKKSYYPELQKRIRELEETNSELQHEIQERKKSEELREKLLFQLNQSQKMEAIGSLAGGIAHDFNNILSAIVGYTELTSIQVKKCSSDSPCEASQNLQGILRSADRAKQLVHQILSFSRQQTGEMHPVSLEDLLTETLKMLRALIPATISITPDIQTTESMVLADSTQLHQVIMNLGTNGYHAMRDTGGSLLFELFTKDIYEDDLKFSDLKLPAGPYLVLSVSDTGCGMDRSTLSKIFDPYFSTKGEEGGTGLGLSVVHGIISQHRGHIDVYSALGRGTTFRIYLPTLRETQKETSAFREAREVILGHERLLVVDDEQPLREITKHILQDLGYKVTTEATPMGALNRFIENPQGYDLLLTDMNMPKMSGAELIRQVREVRSDIPVILCTGFSETMNEQSTRELGSARHILKPVTQNELHKVIRSLLDT